MKPKIAKYSRYGGYFEREGTLASKMKLVEVSQSLRDKESLSKL